MFFITSTTSHAGSTGTVGGGDNNINIMDLIPNHIEIENTYTLSSRQDPIVIGKERCFGVSFFPMCPIYAYEIRVTSVFDKKDTKPMLTKSCIGVNRTYSKLLSSEVCAVPINWFNKSVSKILWDMESISSDEFAKRIEVITNTCLSRVDFEKTETIRDVVTLKEKFYDLFFIDSSTLVRDPVQALWNSLAAIIHNQAKEFESFAKTIVSESNQCDLAKYQQLRTQLQNWRLGSRKYMDRLAVETGLKISGFYQTRGRVFLMMNEEVEPYCQDSANQNHHILIEGDGKEPLLLDQ